MRCLLFLNELEGGNLAEMIVNMEKRLSKNWVVIKQLVDLWFEDFHLQARLSKFENRKSNPSHQGFLSIL
ncbi:hypothetical protein QX25_21980 [Stutzerimonas stutzeri]|jgi:hypothetical protein|nr:hypothetical protein QX25_21980 [Stutzerimonas stutzeri]KZX59934.1 hypothetical protein A3710_03215 [Stutzerimonas frequens]MAL90124.1 hypothetical protein [Pseudomonas sp.]RFF64821.1 hypothetical protein D0A22_02830 [Stutzerimonas stutzeri]|tara:strand:- start:320 stop:529 length:210 start_codon:yes stop_codon:yes gene_type:complete